MKKALLVFHSPIDVDHLLSRKADAAYVADVLVAWADRYIGAEAAEGKAPQVMAEADAVVVSETGEEFYAQAISVGGFDGLLEAAVGRAVEVDAKGDHDEADNVHEVHVEAGVGEAAEDEHHLPVARRRRSEDRHPYPREEAREDGLPQAQTLGRLEASDGRAQHHVAKNMPPTQTTAASAWTSLAMAMVDMVSDTAWCSYGVN